MQTSKRTVSLKNVVRIVVVLSMVFTVASMGLYQYALSTVGPGEQSEQWYSPEMEATYLVGPFNSTFFFARNHTGYGLSAYEGYELVSSNDTDLIQYCVNVSSTDGGKVFVKPGSYAASVTLKNKVRLVLEKGAATVTVTINASATAVLEDWNAGRVRYWKSGTVTWDSNLDAGSLTTLSSVLSGALNVTTIYVTTIDSLVAATGTKILKLIVENGTSFPTTNLVDCRMFYRWDEGYLYLYNNSAWKQVGTTLYSNLTGTPDLTTLVYVNGTNALTGNWNVGGSYGIYGATWVNATNLSANYVYFGSLTSDPVSPTAGQLWYRSDLDTLYFYNGTGIVVIPSIGGGSTSSYMLPFTYTIYKSGSNHVMEKYDGTTWSSTNAALVLQNALGNCSAGGTIAVKGGRYDLGSSTMNVSYGTANNIIWIMGIPDNNNVTFVSNGTKMFDSTTTSWATAYHGFKMTDCFVEWAAPTNASICFDLTYSYPTFINVQIKGTNRTTPLGGTGFKTGPTASTGAPVSFTDCLANYVGVSFEIAMDHTSLRNCMSYDASYAGFYIHDLYFDSYTDCQYAYDTSYSVASTVYPFLLSSIHNGQTFTNPSVERIGGTYLTHPLFTYVNVVTTPNIFGFDGTAGNVLADTVTNYEFYGYSYNYTTEMVGTGTFASGTNSTAITFGSYFANTTPKIWCSGTSSEDASIWVSARSQTGFTANIAANTTGSRTFYWWARIY